MILALSIQQSESLVFYLYILFDSASKVFACHECLKCFPDTESRRAHEQEEHSSKSNLSLSCVISFYTLNLLLIFYFLILASSSNLLSPTSQSM